MTIENQFGQPGRPVGRTLAGQVKRDRTPGKGRTNTMTESLNVYPKDRELLVKIMDYYGCSKSEAFRTVLRAHAAQIGVT